MAPPTKPSASSKGTNPAPDFTVNMNRIQTQLEARMKTVRSFLPSRSNLQTPNPNSAGGSFSALSSAGPQPPSYTSTPRSLAADSAARRAAAEAEFAEDRNLDPNVGIGVARATSGASETNGRDRDTAQLRGRLLGKRGKGNEGAEKRWARKEESSDEEAGRSGLGRSKKGGKRSRTEMEGEDREEEVAEVKAAIEIHDKGGEDEDVRGDTENSTLKSTKTESSAPTTEGNPKKRRKKKKKSKNKTDEA
ncbi:hypothetical protein F5B19DRAFT_441652 [Rostrohypoxylon terebratum]|nr:hypothetical protein F5B19DRAFT_441652 [Rostrohypoxylon terebratum]